MRSPNVLRPSQLKAVQACTGSEIFENPVLLAMWLCSQRNAETTGSNESTRLDVLHTLAVYFNELQNNMARKGLPVPKLKTALRYGKQLLDGSILHTFILGLSSENRARAQKLMAELPEEKIAPSSPEAFILLNAIATVTALNLFMPAAIQILTQTSTGEPSLTRDDMMPTPITSIGLAF